MKIIFGKNSESVWPVWIIDDNQDPTSLIKSMTDRANSLFNQALGQGYHTTDSIYVGSELDQNANYTGYRLVDGMYQVGIQYFVMDVPIFSNAIIEKFNFVTKYKSVKWNDEDIPMGSIPAYIKL